MILNILNMKYQTIIAGLIIALLTISRTSHQPAEPCKILDAKFYPHSATDYSYKIKFNNPAEEEDRLRLAKQLFHSQIPNSTDCIISIQEYPHVLYGVYIYNFKIGLRRLKLPSDSTENTK